MLDVLIRYCVVRANFREQVVLRTCKDSEPLVLAECLLTSRHLLPHLRVAVKSVEAENQFLFRSLYT